MPKRYDVWLILNEKSGKDIRLQFTFDCGIDLSNFLIEWSKRNNTKESKWILEIVKDE